MKNGHGEHGITVDKDNCCAHHHCDVTEKWTKAKIVSKMSTKFACFDFDDVASFIPHDKTIL